MVMGSKAAAGAREKGPWQGLFTSGEERVGCKHSGPLAR